jgi:hypothetical protein
LQKVDERAAESVGRGGDRDLEPAARRVFPRQGEDLVASGHDAIVEAVADDFEAGGKGLALELGVSEALDVDVAVDTLAVRHVHLADRDVATGGLRVRIAGRGRQEEGQGNGGESGLLVHWMMLL